MIKEAIFLTSAADKYGWIEDDIKEILFLGRSNVGKSTLINALTNKKKLAKTSSTPGKTRLLNFFDINKSQFRIVDAPGYGYAKISREMKIQFGSMMDEYLLERKNLSFICQLVDLRHAPSKEDKEMYDFLKHYSKKVLVIATKRDKVKRNDIIKNEKMIKNKLEFDSSDYFLSVSSLSKENIDKIYSTMIEMLSNNGDTNE